MKLRGLAFVTLAALACSLSATAQTVAVPRGTEIRIRLAENLSSVSAKNDDPVHLEVLDDVIIDGQVVIPHGSSAMGKITDAKAKRRMGRAGHIELAFRYVSAADQSQIPVSGNRRVKGDNSAGLIGIGIAATAPTPLAPLFLLAHGHDTEIAVGTAFTVYTDADASVDFAKVPPPAPKPPPSVVPTASPFHVIRGETISGPAVNAPSVGSGSVADAARAARIAKAKKDAHQP